MRPFVLSRLFWPPRLSEARRRNPGPHAGSAVPGAAPHDYGVYHFRRTFRLAAKPASFRVHVTADQRYQLFVNGKRAGLGPARGDLTHWRYETYDIAPLLEAGDNVLAAVVWNVGAHSPVAQITNETGFLLAGETEAERAAETGEHLEVHPRRGVCTGDGRGKVRGYFAIGVRRPRGRGALSVGLGAARLRRFCLEDRPRPATPGKRRAIPRTARTAGCSCRAQSRCRRSRAERSRAYAAPRAFRHRLRRAALRA